MGIPEIYSLCQQFKNWLCKPSFNPFDQVFTDWQSNGYYIWSPNFNYCIWIGNGITYMRDTVDYVTLENGDCVLAGEIPLLQNLDKSSKKLAWRAIKNRLKALNKEKALKSIFSKSEQEKLLYGGELENTCNDARFGDKRLAWILALYSGLRLTIARWRLYAYEKFRAAKQIF